MDTLAISAGKLVFSGFCLCLGFWAAKKLTNKIDEFIGMNSRDIEEFMNNHSSSRQKAG